MPSSMFSFITRASSLSTWNEFCICFIEHATEYAAVHIKTISSLCMANIDGTRKVQQTHERCLEVPTVRLTRAAMIK